MSPESLLPPRRTEWNGTASFMKQLMLQNDAIYLTVYSLKDMTVTRTSGAQTSHHRVLLSCCWKPKAVSNIFVARMSDKFGLRKISPSNNGRVTVALSAFIISAYVALSALLMCASTCTNDNTDKTMGQYMLATWGGKCYSSVYIKHSNAANLLPTCCCFMLIRVENSLKNKLLVLHWKGEQSWWSNCLQQQKNGMHKASCIKIRKLVIRFSSWQLLVAEKVRM